MPALKLTEEAPGYYTLKGSLTFASIDSHAPQPFKFLRGVDSMSIDLSQLQASDSAGLALMIEWIRQSRMSRVKLSFRNIPEQLMALARISGLDDSDYFIGHDLNTTSSPTDNS
ncbi:MAG: STAS domain-containing protein [Methylococcaceae bacterium]|jgi:phospholipid transport system transporter-binding protein|nr:STAS domain-containing protein [Methylococcaceae bacterium]